VCWVQVHPAVCLCSADVSGIDWMVRHGRSLALSVAVNVAPSRLCAGRYSNEVQDMILSNAVADRVRLSSVPPSPHSHSCVEGRVQPGAQFWVLQAANLSGADECCLHAPV
jgi:hypothetical protein